MSYIESKICFCRLPLVKRKPYGDLYDSDSDLSFISPSSHRDSDISFISSGRPSVERSSFSLDFPESARTSRISTSSEQSIGSHRLGIKFSDPGFPNESSTFSEESGRTSSYSSQSLVSTSTSIIITQDPSLFLLIKIDFIYIESLLR